MKTYAVALSDNAEEDIDRIGGYIAQADSVDSALRVVRGIRQTVEGLTELPERARYVSELARFDLLDMREVLYGPYRIIYDVHDSQVRVHLIADSRRDMEPLLMRRLPQSWTHDPGQDRP